MMSQRERVERALRFERVDRAPIDLNLSYSAYQKLCEAAGFNAETQAEAQPKPSLAMEVCGDPALYEQVGVDVYSVKFGMDVTFDGTFLPRATDAWGISYRLVEQQKGMLYEVDAHPLAGASIGALESYHWPAAPTEAMKEKLHTAAKRIYETTGLALCGRFGAPTMETAVGLLGFEEWLVRLMIEPEFCEALLRKIGSVAAAWDLAGIEACGEYLSILKVSGEDLGSQQSLLYSPQTIREVLLPVLKQRWDATHAALSLRGLQAKVMLHTCGAVKPIIPDLLDAGIEVLDPIQPKAAGMDAAGLYADFGGRMVFHGGIDVQEILPAGTPQQVRAHTREILAAMHAINGGFIAAPSHTVQADVPAENILALIEAVNESE